MTQNFTFRPAKPSDEAMIARWLRMPHVVEFWGEATRNIADFKDTLSGAANLFNYWVGFDGNTPFCMLITTDAAEGEPEHLAPFLPEKGDAWTLDVLIGPIEFIGRGIAADMLLSFLHHAQHLNPALKTVFIDPEANNGRAIHVYENAGFRRISEFIPREGAHQGLPHILMAYQFS